MLTKALLRRNFSTYTPVQLKQLPYELGALEPIISGQLLDFHYSKHHRNYVNNLNVALEKQLEALHKGDMRTMIALEKQVHFNGGGHLNHEFFWETLCSPKDSHLPREGGELHKHLVASFGTIDKFISVFNAATAGVMGSGWGWLVYNKNTNQLNMFTTKDQDLISDVAASSVPLLNIDIWEHAYYLDYKNARP